MSTARDQQKRLPVLHSIACERIRGVMTFSSGNAIVDRYIAEGYDTVRGMSSAFAATICGHVIRRQSELGIKGHNAEIGTFEGRFFIAKALGTAEGEHAPGIDQFNWPNDGLPG